MFTHLTDTAKAATYYLITLALAFVVLGFSGTFGESSPVVTMFTPTLGVLIVLLVVTRDGRSRAAWRDLGVHRLGLRGWPLAILGAAVILVVAYIILWVTPFADYKPLSTGGKPLTQIAVNIGFGLVVSSIFAACEEIGWRGYMLPRLLGLGAVPAMLIVGFCHGLWHLPLLIGTPYYHNTGNLWIVVPLFLITLTLAGLFYGYLRLWTGSVWPVAIAHGVYNLVWNILGNDLTAVNNADAVEYVGGESGVIVIVLLLVAAPFLIAATRRLGLKPSAAVPA